MVELWRLIIETSVPPEDFPTGATLGYMNVITWASSAVEAEAKIAAYLKTFDWHVLEVDQSHRVDDLSDVGEVLQEMIERARTNENAIILGTFHSYRVN